MKFSATCLMLFLILWTFTQGCTAGKNEDVEISISPATSNLFGGGIHTQEEFVITITSSGKPVPGIGVSFLTSVGGFERGCETPIMTDEQGKARTTYIPPGWFSDFDYYSDYNAPLDVVMQFSVSGNGYNDVVSFRNYKLFPVFVKCWNGSEQDFVVTDSTDQFGFDFSLFIYSETSEGRLGISGVPLVATLTGLNSDECDIDPSYQESVDGTFTFHVSCDMPDPRFVISYTIDMTGMDTCDHLTTHYFTDKLYR